MHTRSQSRNSNRQQQQVNPTFVKSFNLVEPIENQAPPVVTMDDNRTMTQLLEAPTVGYEDAIVVPEITADNFELKHGLLTLVQNKQFFGHDKEDPHAHICYFNKITSTMKFPNVPSTSVMDIQEKDKNQSQNDKNRARERKERERKVKSKPKVNKKSKSNQVKVNPRMSTKDVQPPVLQVQPHVPNSKPAVAPVSAPMPNLKSTILYPSRRNDERRHEKSNDQIEKFYEIFKDLSSKISLTDALILLPKFASTLKALIGNK
ncbi:hypothetical protein Tco_1335169 [Tanacetum coccineum]